MAQWSYIMISRLQLDWFRAFTLYSFIAGTLTKAASNSIIYAVEVQKESGFRRLQNFSSSLFDKVFSLARQGYFRAINGQIGVWDMVQLIAACSLVQVIRIWKNRKETQHKGNDHSNCSALGGCNNHKSTEALSWKDSGSMEADAEITDPGLLKKHSSFSSYATSIGTYPFIRTFYRPHAQADKLPSTPTSLPLLVFAHGLGGSLAQFHPLLTSLVNVAPCLGIDLPGCGLSKFSPTSWHHYTTSALVELLGVVIHEHCYRNNHTGIILVGHSMGCSLSALLASNTSPLKLKNNIEVLALIAICPKATLPNDQQIATFKNLLRIPTPIFNLWRTWDRRGGTESLSVARFVGPEADLETKKLQERFNTQSRTAVWRRMAWGALPKRNNKGVLQDGLPGLEVWAGLNIPLFLVAGEADGITKVSEIEAIGRALGKTDKLIAKTSIDTGRKSSTLPQLNISQIGDENKEEERNAVTSEPRTSTTETTIIGENLRSGVVINGGPDYSKKRQVLKTSVLPAPASHALLYDPATYRTLAGLIQKFLYDHVDSRLSLGWQLQHLSTEGKWDVKNLAKWQAVPPVSEPVAGIFRAMKTLREVDKSHSPEIFVHDWKGKIRAVIDISHESPVYDPKGLDEGGIEYHKFPTVSKIPPTAEEVRGFIKLVDRVRADPPTSGAESALIGVHCHYGFNRTGFFICSYLVEKENFGVQQAIDEFAAHRPPGIKHEHFLDTLFVRYCVGLKRTPTL